MSLWIIADLETEDALVRCPFYDNWTQWVELIEFPSFDIGEKPVKYCPACMFPHPLPGPYARYHQVHGKMPEWEPVEQEDRPDPEPSIEDKLKAAEESIRKAVEENESRRHNEQDGSIDRDEIRGHIIRDGKIEPSSESVSGEGNRGHDQRLSDDDDGRQES